LGVDLEFRVRGDALCGFGAVVFVDELQVDVGGGAIGFIEFAAATISCPIFVNYFWKS
jgi:hypothetical protein